MRPGVFVAVTLWLTPVMAVGLHAFGVPNLPGLVVGLMLAAAVGWGVSRPLASALEPASGARVLVVATALFAAVAIVQIARVSVFMADPARVDYSYNPADRWRTAHCCLTAYAEATRFATEGSRNIYDMELYEPRTLGPLKVDSFHYPPPFLLLPAALRAIRPDFFQLRALWFTMQALILAGTVLGLACWLRGRAGTHALIGGTFLLATPQVVYSLQQGNFQITAVCVATAALILIGTGRVKRGAGLLAYVTAAKIFPGILIIYLAAARQWRAVAWTAACGIALLVMTLVLFGRAPLVDFVRDEVPRISSGAAFPQSERSSIAQVNQSVYGLTVRLRRLGAGWLDAPTGLAIASVFGLFVIALAGAAGWKSRLDLSGPAGRLRLVQLALALISLGSFRSPFVGFYGLVGTFWLLTLLAAEARTARALLGALTLIAVYSACNWRVPSPTYEPTTFVLVGSAALFLIALGVNLYAVMRAVRAPHAIDARRAVAVTGA
jgi:glycosyl transferase family 87